MRFKLFKSSPYSVSQMVWMRVFIQRIHKATDNNHLISPFSHNKMPIPNSIQEEVISKSLLKTTNHWIQTSYPNSRISIASNPVISHCSTTTLRTITNTKSTTTNRLLNKTRCNSIVVSNMSETEVTVIQLRSSIGKAELTSKIIRKRVWKMVTMWTHSQLQIYSQIKSCRILLIVHLFLKIGLKAMMMKISLKKIS